MEQEQEFKADLVEATRLDKYLSERFPSFSRSYFQKLVDDGFVTLNNKLAKKRFLVQMSDLISVNFQTPKPLDLKPYDLKLEVLFEDEHLLAINKPTGLVVHPAPGHYDKTLVNALISYLGPMSDFDNPLRPGIIHRLDKDTSGVILCAKTPKALLEMTKLFADRQIKKTYVALCQNRPLVKVIEGPISRHHTKRKEMVINSEGKAATTLIDVLGYDEKYSLVEAKPITGRTHQIRVHLKSIRCPIVSDPIYGSLNPDFDRLMLHAKSLEFTHPFTGECITIEAPLDLRFKKLLETFQA